MSHIKFSCARFRVGERRAVAGEYRSSKHVAAPPRSSRARRGSCAARPLASAKLAADLQLFPWFATGSFLGLLVATTPSLSDHQRCNAQTSLDMESVHTTRPIIKEAVATAGQDVDERQPTTGGQYKLALTSLAMYGLLMVMMFWTVSLWLFGLYVSQLPGANYRDRSRPES